MYIFNYTLDEKDCLEFIKFRYFNLNATDAAKIKKGGNPKYLIFYLVTLVIVLFAGIFSTNAILSIISYILASLFAIVALLIIFLILWPRITAGYAKLLLKSLKKKGKLPFGKNIRFELSEEYVAEFSELAEVKVKYENIEKVVEASNAIYIYFNAIQVFALPYRAFESEQQKTEFLSFIKGKVPSKLTKK